MRAKRLIESAQLPSRGTPRSAGYDLVAAERAVIPQSVARGAEVDIGRAVVRTGIAIELPPGTVGRIGSRSGLSVKKNIEVGAGWIDPDYRGEVLVELKNLSSVEVVFEIGDRIAQLFVMRVQHPRITWTKSLSATKRGAGGFGSTGTKTRSRSKRRSTSRKGR